MIWGLPILKRDFMSLEKGAKGKKVLILGELKDGIVIERPEKVSGKLTLAWWWSLFWAGYVTDDTSTSRPRLENVDSGVISWQVIIIKLWRSGHIKGTCGKIEDCVTMVRSELKLDNTNVNVV